MDMDVNDADLATNVHTDIDDMAMDDMNIDDKNIHIY